ncbi:MAG: hypothetical protein JXR96_24755 [Deltaproteobacteria bacterium]|nr:hypothetical protein [Deltaproteobacteria bacterium]
MRTAFMLGVVWALVTGALALEAQADEPKKSDEAGKTSKTSKTGEKVDPFAVPDSPADSKSEAASTVEVVVPSGYPVSEVARPLALPRFVLEPELSFRLDFMEHADNRFSVCSGARFGAWDNLEAGLLFPLYFAPKFRAGDMEIYGLYDLSAHVNYMKLAARLRTIIPLSDELSHWYTDFAMLAETFAKIEFHRVFALTGAFGMGFSAGDRTVDNRTVDRDEFLIEFELGALLAPIEPLSFHFTFGVLGFGDDAILPMKLRSQYTLIHDLDIFFDVIFVDLDEGADWVMMIAGAAYRIGF